MEIFSSGTRRAPVNTTKPAVVFITAFLILNSALRASMGTTATAFQERSPQITRLTVSHYFKAVGIHGAMRMRRLDYDSWNLDFAGKDGLN